MTPVTAIDTETGLADVYEPIPRLVSVAAAGALGRGLYHHTDPRARDVLAAARAQGGAVANAPEDGLAARRRWPELLGNVVAAYVHGRILDVLTRARMLDIALGRFEKKFDLGSVARRWCDLEVDKDDPWRRRYIELIDVPIEHWPEAARRYAQHDADATIAVFEAQERENASYSPTLLGTQLVHARAHLAL